MNTVSTACRLACLKWAVLAALPLAGACSSTMRNAAGDETYAIPAALADAVLPTSEPIPRVMLNPQPFMIELGAREAPRWFYPDELDRFRCSVGRLTCWSGSGRLSPRLCKCM